VLGQSATHGLRKVMDYTAAFRCAGCQTNHAEKLKDSYGLCLEDIDQASVIGGAVHDSERIAETAATSRSPSADGFSSLVFKVVQADFQPGLMRSMEKIGPMCRARSRELDLVRQVVKSTASNGSRG